MLYFRPLCYRHVYAVQESSRVLICDLNKKTDVPINNVLSVALIL